MHLLPRLLLAVAVLTAQPVAVAVAGANQPVPVLMKSGTCPGPMNLTVTGATPGRPVAIFYGFPGNFTNPNPPCAGLVLDLTGPPGATPVLATIQIANGAGVVSINFGAPPAICGRTVQAVDVFTCTKSNTVTL